MQFKTPKFWNSKIKLKLFIVILLLPVSIIYYCLFKFVQIKRSLKKTITINKKVICVGNIVVGGSGKTPISLMIGNLLQKNGYKICFLSKGYKRSKKGFLKLNKNSNPFEYGDEPVLLNRLADTFVYSKAEEIVNLNNTEYDFVIMDDGIHNTSIHKDFSFLVRDVNFKNGNGFIFPSGPLRCFYKDIKYDLLIDIIGQGVDKKIDFIKIDENRKNNENVILSLILSNSNTKCSVNVLKKTKINVYSAISEYEDLLNVPIIAFCGIARADKFFTSIRSVELRPLEEVEFSDHFIYKVRDVFDLIKKSIYHIDVKYILQQDFITNNSLDDIIYKIIPKIITTEKDIGKILYLQNEFNQKLTSKEYDIKFFISNSLERCIASDKSLNTDSIKNILGLMGSMDVNSIDLSKIFKPIKLNLY